MGHPPQAESYGRSLPKDTFDACYRLVALVLMDRDRQQVRTLAHRIARRPSLGSSEGNHRIGELAALAVARAYLHQSPKDWGRQVNTLPGVFRRQLHPDGWPIEQSTGYHLRNLEWALLAISAAPHLAQGLRPQLKRGYEAARHLFSPAGSLSLGDSDDSKVLPFGSTEAHEGSIMTCLAGVIGEQGKPQPSIHQHVLGLPVGRQVHWPSESKCFAQGGVVHLIDGERHAWLTRGLGRPPTFGHQHDNALACHISIGKAPLFGHQGTFQYTGNIRVRNHLRSRHAQPCPLVLGAGTGRPSADPFLWDKQPTTGDLVSVGPKQATACMPMKELGGVLYRRVQTSGDKVIIDDWFEGHRPVQLIQQWPLFTHADAGPSEARVGQVHITCLGGELTSHPAGSGAWPGHGFRATSYGHRQPASVLHHRGTVRPGQRLTTIIQGR